MPQLGPIVHWNFRWVIAVSKFVIGGGSRRVIAVSLLVIAGFRRVIGGYRCVIASARPVMTTFKSAVENSRTTLTPPLVFGVFVTAVVVCFFASAAVTYFPVTALPCLCLCKLSFSDNNDTHNADELGFRQPDSCFLETVQI